ncbi:MAG: hypothetical protein FWD55_06610 [Propionibacteriaceae bacterium]|nr:hypothetical protein [Propionibacteriaceae bacterium]
MRIGCSLWNVSQDSPLDHARRLVDAGVDLFHWDRADGIFAKAGGYTADTAAEICSQTGTRAEAHLMVADPLREIDAWCEFCELVVVPVESEDHLAAIRRIENRGRQAAIVISPDTDLSALDHLCHIPTLVMSITPGYAGSQPRPETLTRLAALRDRPLLGIDGGMTADLLPSAAQAGANWVAVGTALVHAEDPAAWLRLARTSN